MYNKCDNVYRVISVIKYKAKFVITNGHKNKQFYFKNLNDIKEEVYFINSSV